jgi:uncharacterized protein
MRIAKFSSLAVTLAICSTSALAGLPRPLGWVSDYADLLDNSQKQQIGAVIESINRSTGVEIAVVTQSSLGDYGSIEEMGLAYLEGWGVGQENQDNGLVILVVIDPEAGYRRYRFESGYGLEGDLPDGLLGQIGREEIVPRFQEGQYGPGIMAALMRIGDILGADMSAQRPTASPVRGKGIGSLVFLLFFLLLLFSRRGRGSGLLWLLLLGGFGGSRRSGGGFGGGGFGGGFGGFGGGAGGGGGASGSW